MGFLVAELGQDARAGCLQHFQRVVFLDQEEVVHVDVWSADLIEHSDLPVEMVVDMHATDRLLVALLTQITRRHDREREIIFAEQLGQYLREVASV